MTLNTQRKLSLGVLGLGVSALIIDQVFLSAGGEAAPAASYAVETAAPAGLEDEPAPFVDAARSRNSIRERLSTIAVNHTPGLSADAFMAPASWRVVVQEAADDGMQVETPVTTFQTNYTLRTVMGAKGGTGFVTLQSHKLNEPGRFTLTTGAVIDGHKLVKIDERSAVFEGPTGQVTLKLADPDTGRRDGPVTLITNEDDG